MAASALNAGSALLTTATCAGTLAPTIVFGVIEFNALVLGPGLICSILDLTYVAILLWSPRTALHGASEALLRRRGATGVAIGR